MFFIKNAISAIIFNKHIHSVFIDIEMMSLLEAWITTYYTELVYQCMNNIDSIHNICNHEFFDTTDMSTAMKK